MNEEPIKDAWTLDLRGEIEMSSPVPSRMKVTARDKDGKEIDPGKCACGKDAAGGTSIWGASAVLFLCHECAFGPESEAELVYRPPKKRKE